MGRKKLLHSFAGVVTRSILNDKDMLRGLGQNIEQKGRIALRIASTCMGFGEKASREIVNQSKDLIGLTNATGGDFRLMSPRGPGVAQGTPLGKAGLSTKEQQGLPLAGAPQYSGPRLVAPLQALRLVEVSGHKAGFLVRKAEVVQQGTNGVRMIPNAKMAVDKILEHRGTPAARGIPRRLRTGFDQGAQGRALCFGELAWPS
jgi:hypothetical protein